MSVVTTESKSLEEVNYIFCSDDYLLKINQDYLDHDYYTDIITFPYNYQPIKSDIYISIDRVAENAVTEQVSFIHELHRVIVHGLLHMCGYDDHDSAYKLIMRQKEDHYLALIDQIN
jgi:rRNA maturation RNase YbeY